MTKQSKLHEILAVEGDLEGAAKRISEETIVTFNKKTDHFVEQTRRLVMFDDARSGENTDETNKMVTTVGAKLEHTRRAVIKYLDVFAAKETTNQVAKADLEVDGVVIAKDMPATALLGLESRLKQVRAVYEAIPTLQPGVDWAQDPTREAGVWRAQEPEVKMRTEKQIRHKVLVEPTKEHPAQVEKWTQDVPIGRITVDTWSGMLSPAEKSVLIGRIDTLLQAVKRARQRANSTEIVNKPVGKSIFDYIHGA